VSGLSPAPGLPPVTARARLSLAASACLVLSASGCAPWVGPFHARIETGEAPVDDFVIVPGKLLARLHHTETVYLESRVVPSEREITLPRISRGPTFVGLVINAHHPRFRSAQSRVEPDSGGRVDLKPIRPVSWSAYLADGGVLDLERVYNHLYAMRAIYVPAFEAGEARRGLKPYLPGLVELAARAEVARGDLRRWGTEEAARRAIDDELAAISELLR
jgi:hypothetical protein